MTRFASIAAFEAALADLGEPDAGAAADARVRQGELTKPAGSLGRLEDLAIFFAGWQGRTRRSEEHTSELQSLMRITYAVFSSQKNKNIQKRIISLPNILK